MGVLGVWDGKWIFWVFGMVRECMGVGSVGGCLGW